MIRCHFSQGFETSLRHVVVDVVVVKEGKLLLVRRATKLVEGGKWALVGGYVERDETIEQAARREVLEESGYEVGELQLVTVRDNPDRPNEDTQNISFVFIADALEQKTQPDWEVTEIAWFEVSSLPPRDEIAFDHYLNIELWKMKNVKAE